MSLLDIEKIKTVLEVANSSSFTEASYNLSLSQSSVSKHIQCIENELGIKIFNRSNHDKSVKLTESGETFIRYAKEIVYSNDALIKELSDTKSLAQIPMVISSIPMPGAFSRSAIISKLYSKNPRIQVSFVSKNQHLIADMLIKKEIDVAIVRSLIKDGEVLSPEAIFFDGRFHIEEICENPCVVALSESHYLASHKVLYLKDLEKECIVLQRPIKNHNNTSSLLRFNLFTNSCRSAGFEPNILPNLDPKGLQGEVDLDFVRQGKSVMVINVKMPKKLNGLKLIPLKGLDWSSKTLLISLAGRKTKLRDELSECLHELATQ